MAISGVVSAEREAVVRPTVFGASAGSSERSVEVEAILDTGFTGHPTLSPTLVADLGLPLLGSQNSVLADGIRIALDISCARILWDGRRRMVEVLATRGGALAGMSLIWGHRVNPRSVEEGEVAIEPL